LLLGGAGNKQSIIVILVTNKGKQNHSLLIIFNLTFDPTVCLGLGENIRFADTKEVNRTRKSDIKQYNGLQNDKKDNKQCSTLHRSFVVLLPCLPLFIYAIALSIID
jgi:hypothetical protein